MQAPPADELIDHAAGSGSVALLLLLLIAAPGEPPDVQVTALFTILIAANTVMLSPSVTSSPRTGPSRFPRGSWTGP